MVPSAMTELGRERPSPWYGADCVFVCVCFLLRSVLLEETNKLTFVCVTLCAYSRVGASCVGRPNCVCDVWAPFRRVQIHK